ncbi:Fc.00g074640.m01.CDS01 [Cosmosporella sp. VM-42]
MAPAESTVSTPTMGLPYSLEKTRVLGVDRNLGDNLLTKESPGVLAGPLVWSGPDFKGNQAYTLQLNEDDLVEIDDALANFKTLGLDGDEVGQHNFALPNLARRLRTCAETLHLGRGFSVIRGLETPSYSLEDSVVVFLGISSYIAEKRGLQDRKGNMLSHVTDSKQWTVPAERRHGIHSNGPLPFHSDMGCDILSLQVRHSAYEGGYTYLSSAWTVFNDLLNREPEVVRTLMAPNWPVQISGRKRASYYLAPVFTFHDGKLLASVDPHRLGPHPSMTNSNIPALTEAQLYALQAVSESAYRTELQLKLQTGDLLFFNNLALLHRRDAYKDDDSSSRHMVRLWLRSQKLGWSIPDSILTPWKAAYGENRKILARIYPLVPMSSYPEPKYTTSSAAFMIEDSDESDSE